MEKKIEELMNKKKGLILKEFEKVCPTDSSFQRMIKEMHNIFEGLAEDIMKISRESDNG